MGTSCASAVSSSIIQAESRLWSFRTKFDSTQPGIAIFQLGLLNGSLFFPPYGFVLIGNLSPVVFLGAVPTGTDLPFPVPGDVGFLGLDFGVQAACLPLGFPGLGQASNLYRGTVIP